MFDVAIGVLCGYVIGRLLSPTQIFDGIKTVYNFIIGLFTKKSS